MKAVVWKKPWQVELEEVPEPVLLAPTDVIVRVTKTAVCGTDLHPYRGQLSSFRENTILGHEFTGIVEQVGETVRKWRVGDRVVGSDLVACGECWYCRRDLHYHCTQVSLFGYGDVVGTYTPGAQAERVRVPFADQVLFKIPDGIAEEEALFVGDILSTGYGCAEAGAIEPGDTVLIIGAGPVGLMAVLCAQTFSPARVFVIEPNQNRHVIARQMGAVPLLPTQADVISSATAGRGADVVLEAVGRQETLQAAIDWVRPKGRVVCVGAHHEHAMPFNTEQAFAKELHLQFVVGNPMKHAQKLLHLIEEGRLQPSQIVTHRLRLEEAVRAYDLFDRQEAVKIVLSVSEEGPR